MIHTTKNPLRKTARKTGGSLVEYAVILALIAMVCAVLLRAVGQNTNSKMAGVLPGLSE